MASAAILVGNSDYRNHTKLDCCRDDVTAIKQLLVATEKYEEITTIENASADELKSHLRTAVDKVKSPTELFFYFTGHGYQHETEFFYCATNFDSKKPNETGVSTSELHTLLRLADADVVVKVVDACNSGTLLLKSEGGILSQTKGPFKNLIQIASCLESQYSLTGNPLSLFTEKFRSAALRKTEGAVFYMDIISTLRDEFINNNLQTPFFVSQYTGREQFVDDAKRLDELRSALNQIQTAAQSKLQDVHMEMSPAKTLLERLKMAEAKVVQPEILSKTVGDFFDNLINKATTSEFSEFFTVEFTEHAHFEELTTEKFIIGILSKESRPDNFVTASHSRKLRKRNPLFSNAFLEQFLDDDAFEENWHLRLNCAMSRTQLRITFTPKFANLQRIVLVVSCAPSLDHCYIFELATRHALQDFGKFDSAGPEISRRWWKLDWRESSSGIVNQISDKITQVVRAQLESAEERLSKS